MSCLSIFFLLAAAFSFTLAVPSPLTSSQSANLHRRVYSTRALTSCQEGHDGQGLGGDRAGWVFQQSWCSSDNPYGRPSYHREFRILCRAPGSPSMLQGPVPWHREAYGIGECDPSQICVDGPYTPPNPLLAANTHWYKTHGTAYCVDQQQFNHMSRDGLRVLAAAEGGGGGPAK
ncbi:hypothetical protein MMC19_003707 [Ptychographa xylographoides]|nr:hypothetical protein [Ptychographa xylographoides]